MSNLPIDELERAACVMRAQIVEPDEWADVWEDIYCADNDDVWIFISQASPNAVLDLIHRLKKAETALQEIVDYSGWEEDGGAEARYIAQEALR